MQFFGKRAASRTVLAATIVALAACSDTQETPFSVTDDATSSTVQSGTVPANHQLARLVSVALRDAAVRSQLRQDMAASPVKEGKLYFRSYLKGNGKGLLTAMSRAAGTTEQEVLNLVYQVEPLEIYLPSEEYRTGWKGDGDLIVGTLLNDEEAPFAIHTNGQVLKIAPRTLPTTTAISLVRAESFDEMGQPLDRDLAGGRSDRIAVRTSTSTSGWYGLWVTEVHIADKCNYECGFAGNPEFEMWLEKASDRAKIACQDEDYSISPFRWNMDDNDYYSDFLLQEDVKIPSGTKMVVAMWEDDKTRCEALPAGAKDYVKLAVDVITNAAGAYKAFKEKGLLDGQTVVALSHAVIALKAMTDNGDDFVGVSSGDIDITGAETRVSLSNHNGTTVGWMKLQYTTK